ncbi:MULTISPECIES: hypothetical protein [Bradyrhizobium]|uniref:hypothetical protein n=1 Tax=Bradyrhizobium TaxID=374 RepID=UPI0004B292DB|nr:MULTISPECIES: hypothetical protein [unclassified Bradyrhizobium]
MMMQERHLPMQYAHFIEHGAASLTARAGNSRRNSDGWSKGFRRDTFDPWHADFPNTDAWSKLPAARDG